MRNNIIRSVACIVLMLIGVYNADAQNSTQARQILDRTANKILSSKNGASANFSISNGRGMSASGTVSIKGNKFYASTPQVKVWNNGKTQWAYTISTNEVTISTPNDAQQMSVNPYKFVYLYKRGFRMSYKNKGNNYEVHLTSINPARSIPEIYITINKNYIPTSVKMRQGKSWTTIRISKFHSARLSDNVFLFTKSKAPRAEIVDLR